MLFLCTFAVASAILLKGQQH